MKARITHPLAAVVLGCFLPSALAQTTAPSAPAVATTNTAVAVTSATSAPASGGGIAATTVTAGTASDRRTPPATRLASEFSTLAGSTENASALISGLRSGNAITLNAPAPSDGGTAPGTTSTTFTAPNGPMSYGNIRIALSLAREQLAQDGITDPTPQQLQAALVGSGSTSGAAGILDRRAAGMGWGRIAHDMGTKLGPVLSGHGAKTATTAPATTQPGGQGTSHQRGGIVTAAGDGGGRHAAKATSDPGPRYGAQQQAQQRHVANTPRVVTAAGTTAATAYHGGVRSGGGGVVSASGGNGGSAPKKGGGYGKS